MTLLGHATRTNAGRFSFDRSADPVFATVLWGVLAGIYHAAAFRKIESTWVGYERVRYGSLASDANKLKGRETGRGERGASVEGQVNAESQ